MRHRPRPRFPRAREREDDGLASALTECLARSSQSKSLTRTGWKQALAADPEEEDFSPASLIVNVTMLSQSVVHACSLARSPPLRHEEEREGGISAAKFSG